MGALDAVTLERAAQLRLEVARLLDSVGLGRHRSRQLGASTHFVEHRLYQPGDDVRRLDWRAFARRDKHLVRHFEHEARIDVLLVLDVSGSMAFGDGALEKARYAALALAAAGRAVVLGGDRIAVARLGELTDHLGPGATTTHWERAVELLAKPAAEGVVVDLRRSVAALVEGSPRRRVLLLASDLLDPSERAFDGLRQATEHGWECAVLQVAHPEEVDLMFDGPFQVVGLEGEAPLEVVGSEARAEYAMAFAAHRASCRDRLAAARVRWTFARTDEDVVPHVARLLGARWV